MDVQSKEGKKRGERGSSVRCHASHERPSGREVLCYISGLDEIQEIVHTHLELSTSVERKVVGGIRKRGDAKNHASSMDRRLLHLSDVHYSVEEIVKGRFTRQSRFD